MGDRSFIYLLFFLIIYFAYALYEQDQESERLFKIATDQKEAIGKLRDAVESQKIYIELLENRIRYDYHKNNSPIHENPPI